MLKHVLRMMTLIEPSMYLIAANLPQLFGCLSRSKVKARMPQWIQRSWSSVLSFQSRIRRGHRPEDTNERKYPYAGPKEAQDIQMQISRLMNPMVTVFVDDMHAEILNPRHARS